MSSQVVLCTAGYDHKVRFWEASSRACTRTIRFPESQVNCLAVSNDKLYVAAGGNPHCRIFDVANTANSTHVAQFSHLSNVTAVGFQADRRWIFTGSEDGTVKVWDLRAPQRAQRSYACPFAEDDSYRKAPAPVNSVVLHPNQGELISGDQSGRVRVWDLRANECAVALAPRLDAADTNRERTVSGDSSDNHQNDDFGALVAPAPIKRKRRYCPVRSVAIASDASRLVCGDDDADVYSWRPNHNYELEHVIEAAHCDGSGRTSILKTAISPDAQLLVTTSSDKTAKLWKLPRKKQDNTNNGEAPEEKTQEDTTNSSFTLQRTLAQHQRWVWDACFSADSAYLVTASSDHSARLWDLHSGSAIRYYSGHTLAVTCCALNDSSA